MKLFLFIFLGVRFHVFGHPNVGPYDASAPNGDAAQHGGVRVDYHVVFEYWVACNPLYRVAVFVEREAFCTEGDALV